jgi:hypothetical protein
LLAPRGRRERPLISTKHLGAAVASAAVATAAIPALAYANTHRYWSFNGGLEKACCGHRLYWTTEPHNAGNPVLEALTYNSVRATTYTPIVCAQEYVSLSFYDHEVCGSGSAGHTLNGTHNDQPLCWQNSNIDDSMVCGVAW